MSRLIAVTGYKNSGKNAVCDVLRDSFGFKVTGFADALKAQMLAIDPWINVGLRGQQWARLSAVVAEFGWDVAKERFPEVRRLLQKGGAEGGRDVFGQEVWVDAWYRNVKVLLEEEYDVCVSDMRFLNEAIAVNALDGEVWRIYRPGIVAGEHRSEQELDEIIPDHRIWNDYGLENLEIVVKKLMEAK